MVRNQHNCIQRICHSHIIERRVDPDDDGIDIHRFRSHRRRRVNGQTGRRINLLLVAATDPHRVRLQARRGRQTENPRRRAERWWLLTRNYPDWD